MRYDSAVPSPPLAEFIERFWQCSDDPSHLRERILPGGTFELVVNLQDDEIRIYDPLHPGHFRRYSGAVVSGTYRRSFLIDPKQHASIIGVHFKPGGAFPFLGLPADEMTDTHLDLESLWGPAARELRDQLCSARAAGQRFSLLQNALVSRLRIAPERHRAVHLALRLFSQSHGATKIHHVARRIGLSQRRLLPVFEAEVGLTPKLYCRLQRFQMVRESVNGIQNPNWANVAVHCGYFDQSHLIRDFHAFAGLSPRVYAKTRSADVLLNHLPHSG